MSIDDSVDNATSDHTDYNTIIHVYRGRRRHEPYTRPPFSTSIVYSTTIHVHSYATRKYI